MIIFKYGETKLEDGFYITSIDDEPSEEREVSEYYNIGVDDANWSQLGIDYDVWQFSSDPPNTIKVWAKINLETFEVTPL